MDLASAAIQFINSLQYLALRLPSSHTAVARLYCSAVWDFFFPSLRSHWTFCETNFSLKKRHKKIWVSNLCSLVEFLTVSQDREHWFLTGKLAITTNIKSLQEKKIQTQTCVDVPAFCDLHQLLKPAELIQLKASSKYHYTPDPKPYLNLSTILTPTSKQSLCSFWVSF